MSSMFYFPAFWPHDFLILLLADEKTQAVTWVKNK